MASKRLLLDAGFATVDAAASVDEAFACLAAETYDFCLLDVNLQGALSVPVARHLSEQMVPYAFVTGYGTDGHETAENFGAPLIAKPMDSSKLRDVLNAIFKED